MNTELMLLAERVRQAGSYFDLYGSCDGDADQQTRHIKRLHRRFVKLLHPDRYTQADEKELAKSAFRQLSELYGQAERAVKSGMYGQSATLATIKSRRGEHVVAQAVRGGSLCNLYSGHSMVDAGELPSFIKVARQPTDRDLLLTEAKVLKRLRSKDADARRHVFVPELLDSFAYNQPGSPKRQANVLVRLEGFFTLDQVRQAFMPSLDPLHMAWIWRRLLVAIGFAHDNNVVHGAVLPEHVMILPEQHGVVLVDWCYASLAENGGYPSVKAIVAARKDWYPLEVVSKQPPSPATDIAMAASCMVYVMGGDPSTGNLPNDRVPKSLRAFFKGCLLENQLARPQSAWQLLGEFDQLLERMGPPYYPRRFRSFSMPTGMG